MHFHVNCFVIREQSHVAHCVAAIDAMRTILPRLAPVRRFGQIDRFVGLAKTRHSMAG
jgi:hypothetical protein